MSTISLHLLGLFFLGIIRNGLMWITLGRTAASTYHILFKDTSSVGIL